MMKCRLCHNNVLLNEKGYCYNCFQNFTEKIQECQENAKLLIDQVNPRLTSNERDQLLQKGMEVSRQMYDLSRSPYYKGNGKADVRNLLYALGGTNSDFRSIVGYNREIGYSILAIVLVLSFAWGTWSFQMRMASLGSPSHTSNVSFVMAAEDNPPENE